MSEELTHSAEAVALYEKLKAEAEASGYFLNPDLDFVLDLMEGLLTNQTRYGYSSCPCRLAEGAREADRDIICPCDYRDPDVDEFDACYCALYVSEEVIRGEKQVGPVPERRGTAAAQGWGAAKTAPEPAEGTGAAEPAEAEEQVGVLRGGLPVWRCTVCGYLCARPEPPRKCPICHVDQDRFERFA